MEPQKPFACSILDCGMTFTNEDHLHVHTKKHDMQLQLGAEQKAAFVDQTPTPTRFIRNCEEVGLFQELQNVNPFDEGFRKAMETRAGNLSLESCMSACTEELHTPQMMMYPPHQQPDPAAPPTCSVADSNVYTTTNNHSNITISRSSSDESGAIKEYETTTISKLRNEVTTISRIIGRHDISEKCTDDPASHDDTHGNKETVSYTNNVIEIHSNVEIRKGNNLDTIKTHNPLFAEQMNKDIIMKDVMFNDSNKVQAPVMSQKSIDSVVDSLTADTACHNQLEDKTDMKITKRYNQAAIKKTDEKTKRNVIKLNDVLKNNDQEIKQEIEDYEVIIKLPNQKLIRMQAVDDSCEKEPRNLKRSTKNELKQALINKTRKMAQKQEDNIQNIIENTQIGPNIVSLAGGTLFPVTIVNPITPILLTNSLQKIAIPVESSLSKTTKPAQSYRKTVKRKKEAMLSTKQELEANNTEVCPSSSRVAHDWEIVERSADCQAKSTISEEKSTFAKHFLESRSAASRRYRERLKHRMMAQRQETNDLQESNLRLSEQNHRLKQWIVEHAARCRLHEDYRCLEDLLDITEDQT